MALTLRLNGSGAQNLVTASWWNDYYNLLTGQMADQPITLLPVVTLKAISNAPVGPTLALAAGSALGVGAYEYGVTLVDAAGDETTLPTSLPSITTTTNNQAVTLTNIPLGPATTVARKIYRTYVNFSPDNFFHLVTTINDNTTTSYSDTTPDASLGVTAPVHNTYGGSIEFQDASGNLQSKFTNDGGIIGNLTAQAFGAGPSSAPTAAVAAGTTMGVGAYQYVITFASASGESVASPVANVTTTTNNQNVSLTNIPTGPVGTVSRKVYRTTVGGSTFDLNHTIGDNTTTTYSDSKADGSLVTNQHPPTHPSFGGALAVQNQNGTLNFLLSSDGYILNPIRWGLSLNGSNQTILGINPPDGTKNWQLIYNTNAHLSLWNNTDSVTAFDIDPSGNTLFAGTITIDGTSLIWGAGGIIDWYSAGPSMQYWTPQSGSANGHEFVSWNGSAAVVPFSIGGQFASAKAYVDNTGTFFGLLQTNRNGTKQGNTIFTGTNTPASPATGDIWIKA